MKTYSMDTSDRIAVSESAIRRPDKKAGQFASENEWAEMAAGFPMARLVRIWNGLAGVTPVDRFTSRAKAIERIWKVIRDLEPQPEPQAAVEPRPQSGDTKKEQVLALLKDREGVSLDRLMAATGWQKHSIRGFLSGTVRRNMGLKIISSKDTDGKRLYRVEA
jgi:hypothetical protein